MNISKTAPVISQVSKSWVSSPLGIHHLLSFLRVNEATRANVETYEEIHANLKSKPGFTSKSKIFYSPHCDIDKYEYVRKSDKYILERVDFKNKDAADKVSEWLKVQEDLKHYPIVKCFTSGTIFSLMNVMEFKTSWKCKEKKTLKINVYNSFNYTQDVKYDARILEVPMADDNIKLAIVLPNEADEHNYLFRRLNNQGLMAAINSINPVFKAESLTDPPNIEYEADNRIDISEDFPGIFNGEIYQYGKVSAKDHGATFIVLTCLCSTFNKTLNAETKSNPAAPWLFAVTFKDLPIFTGQYYANK